MPAMNPFAFDEFCENIARNGQNQPGMVFEGKLLDGNHRYKACLKAGLTFKYEEFKGSYSDAIEYVAAQNLERRHLTTSQKACAAALLHECMKQSPYDFKPPGEKRYGNDPKRRTSFKIANIFGIGKTTVERAAIVRKKDRSLFNRILNGSVKLDAAYNRVREKKPVNFDKKPYLLKGFNSEIEDGIRLPDDPLPVEIKVPMVFDSLDHIMIFHHQLLKRGLEAHIHATNDQKWACVYTLYGTPPRPFKPLDYAPDIRTAIVRAGREYLKI
jgi:hypothetical protein